MKPSYVWSFPLHLRMSLIFTDFQQCTWLLKNLLISQPSQGTMENFQRSSGPPIIKYNCVVLFLCQLYLLINYASKYFLIDHHYKRCVIIYWSSRKWQNLVIFLQRAMGASQGDWYRCCVQIWVLCRLRWKPNGTTIVYLHVNRRISDGPSRLYSTSGFRFFTKLCFPVYLQISFII